MLPSMEKKLMDEISDKEVTRFLQAYDPAQAIFREGDSGKTMYVVQDGSVEIHKQGSTETTLLGTLDKGKFFGEMALVDKSPRSATALAGPGGAKVLAIDSAHFVYLVSQQPAFALVVLEVVVSRLRTEIARSETRS